MKISLMFVFGVVLVLTEKFYSVNLQFISSPGITGTSTNSSTSIFAGQISTRELREIHEKAKYISHSKGPIIKDSKEEPEYRRSLIRKLKLKTKSLALRKVIIFFQNSTDDMILPHLDTLEYLVHEYDTAIDFMNIGGMELLTELIQLNDKTIASAALSVLSAAMQGNPTVQAIASNNHILEILLANLASKDYLSSVLYALSSYLRHMPDSQLKFCQHDGISLLVDIMKNHNNPLKFRIHAIQILSDMSYEMFEENSLSNLSFQTSQLIKEFTLGITSTDACKEIALLLECDEYHTNQDKYYIHEKIVDAMTDLQVVCTYIFESNQVQKSVEKLISLYYPHTVFPWYSSVDKHLQNTIYQDLIAFYEKNYQKKFMRKTEL